MFSVNAVYCTPRHDAEPAPLSFQLSVTAFEGLPFFLKDNKSSSRGNNNLKGNGIVRPHLFLPNRTIQAHFYTPILKVRHKRWLSPRSVSCGRRFPLSGLMLLLPRICKLEIFTPPPISRFMSTSGSTLSPGISSDVKWGDKGGTIHQIASQNRYISEK